MYIYINLLGLYLLKDLEDNADLSSDETKIAIFNLHNGIDVYKILGAI